MWLLLGESHSKWIPKLCAFKISEYPRWECAHLIASLQALSLGGLALMESTVAWTTSESLVLPSTELLTPTMLLLVLSVSRCCTIEPINGLLNRHNTHVIHIICYTNWIHLYTLRLNFHKYRYPLPGYTICHKLRWPNIPNSHASCWFPLNHCLPGWDHLAPTNAHAFMCVLYWHMHTECPA